MLSVAHASRSAILSLLLFALLTSGLEACSTSAGAGQSLRSLLLSDHPLALATFEEDRLPIAPGSRGTIGGYFPQSAAGGSIDDPRDAQFTYLIDFHITGSHGLGEQVEGKGVRRVFFSPNGARASFGDVESFGHGRQIQTDKVRFSMHYRQQDSRIDLRVLVYQSRAEPYQLAGYAITAPANEPRLFVGHYHENLGGWLFSNSPGSL